MMKRNTHRLRIQSYSSGNGITLPKPQIDFNQNWRTPLDQICMFSRNLCNANHTYPLPMKYSLKTCDKQGFNYFDVQNSAIST